MGIPLHAGDLPVLFDERDGKRAPNTTVAYPLPSSTLLRPDRQSERGYVPERTRLAGVASAVSALAGLRCINWIRRT